MVQQGTTTLVTPRRLIVVVLGSPDRFGEGAQLLAAAGRFTIVGRRPAARSIRKLMLGGPNE